MASPITTKPALVRALAERVMGWRVADGWKELWEKDRKEITYPVARVMSDNDVLLAISKSESHLWNPLESIADAWMLVEALWPREWAGEVGWHTAISAPGFKDGQRMYRAEFRRTWNRDLNEMAFADTAPLAISLAAASAVGLEVRLA